MNLCKDEIIEIFVRSYNQKPTLVQRVYSQTVDQITFSNSNNNRRYYWQYEHGSPIIDSVDTSLKMPLYIGNVEYSLRLDNAVTGNIRLAVENYFCDYIDYSGDQWNRNRHEFKQYGNGTFTGVAFPGDDENDNFVIGNSFTYTFSPCIAWYNVANAGASAQTSINMSFNGWRVYIR